MFLDVRAFVLAVRQFLFFSVDDGPRRCQIPRRSPRQNHSSYYFAPEQLPVQLFAQGPTSVCYSLPQAWVCRVTYLQLGVAFMPVQRTNYVFPTGQMGPPWIRREVYYPVF